MSNLTRGNWNWFNKTRGWTRIYSWDSQYADLIGMFHETIEYAKLIGLFPTNIDGIAYYLNSRVRAIASCRWHRYSTGEYDIAFSFNREVVAQIPLPKLRETIIHEVAHACSIGDGHGDKWQAACQKIGRHFGLNQFFHRIEQDAAINAVMHQQRDAKAKYLLKCPACGNTWKRQKMSVAVKYAKDCSCPCGWHGLELTILN